VPSCLRNAVTQLDEYFKGTRKKFSLPLVLEGTAFQKKVWRELQKIPYGQTATYKEIARGVGRERAGRAVGQANHLNKMAIVIPCHRVVGSGGGLVGYGGGLWRKKWLLRHEEKFGPKRGLNKAEGQRGAGRLQAITSEGVEAPGERRERRKET
jgi:methylated-DNA-[protein]-cysteine S-methyltransferase